MAPRARLVAIGAALWLFVLVGGARALDDHAVSIQNTSYTDGVSGTPTTTIAEGDSVTWTWNGTGFDTDHSVTSDGDSTQAFNSDEVKDHSVRQHGDTFTVIFPTSGCFKYHCAVHASMHGQIQVGTGVCPPPSSG